MQEPEQRPTPSATTRYRNQTVTRPLVAVLPGDDAAPEAMAAAMTVLRALAPPVAWELLPDGDTLAQAHTREQAEQLVRGAADRCATLLFGATSGKTPGIWSLRWEKRCYANVRPVRWRPGFNSPLKQPEGIDYVIVRENMEDLYVGLEGDLPQLVESGLDLTSRMLRSRRITSGEGRYAIKVLTREHTERVAHFALRLARRRKAEGYPGKLTVATKHNVLPRSDGYFRDVVREVAQAYPDISFESFIVDDFARRLVASPHSLDVVLLPNLYGDVLSDEGAGTIGGLGLAASGCYGDDWAYFESVHGSAPDIMGKHVINPTATLLSAVMLLDYLDLGAHARRLERAIEVTYAEGKHLTPDQGGGASTEEFAEAVVAQLESGS